MLLAGPWVLSTGGCSERKWGLEDSGLTCSILISGYVSTAACVAPTDQNHQVRQGEEGQTDGRDLRPGRSILVV